MLVETIFHEDENVKIHGSAANDYVLVQIVDHLFAEKPEEPHKQSNLYIPDDLKKVMDKSITLPYHFCCFDVEEDNGFIYHQIHIVPETAVFSVEIFGKQFFFTKKTNAICSITHKEKITE